MANQVETVKNRTAKKFEFTFDGQVYVIPPFGEVALVSAAAQHGIRKSNISYNLVTGTTIKALCLASASEADEEVEPRVPGSELIERQPDDEVELQTFSNPDMRGARVTSPLED